MQSIVKEVTVAAPQETAFNVFTRKMGLWWPKSHHVGSCPMTETILESGTNGRWYSKHEDGSEVNIGYVRTWDPFDQVVIIWQINGDFKVDPDLISEIEVQFIPEGPATTRVRLEHRDLDKLRGGTKVIDNMDHGWGFIMDLYKGLVNEQAAIPA